MNHRLVSKSNIAAVEPYIHNPQHSAISSSVPSSNNYYQKQMLQNMANLKLNATDANGNTDDLKMAYIAMNENDDATTASYLLANKSHNKINSYGGGGVGGVGGTSIGGNNNNINNNNNNGNDALMAMGNFSTAKKLDAKYQTLPHTAKYPMASVAHATTPSSSSSAATTATLLVKTGGIPVAVNNYNNSNNVNNNHSNSKHSNSNHQAFKENDSLRMNGGVGNNDELIGFQSSVVTQQPPYHMSHHHQQHQSQQVLGVHGMNGTHPVTNGGDAPSPHSGGGIGSDGLKDDTGSAATTTQSTKSATLANDINMLLVDTKLRTALKEKNNLPTSTLTTKDNNAIISPRKPISSVAPTPISMIPKPAITVSAKVNMVAPSVNSVLPIVSYSEVAEKTPALPPKPNKGPDVDASTSAIAAGAPPTSAIPSISGMHKMNGSSTLSAAQPPTVVSAVNKATAPDAKSQSQSTEYQFSMIGPTQNHDNLPIKAKPLTIKKQPLSEQPRLRSMLPSAKTNQFVSRRIEMPPSFLFPETEKAPLKGDIGPKHSVPMTQPTLTIGSATTMIASTAAAAAAATTAATTSIVVASTTDEPDKATTQTTNEEDIVMPVSNLVKRTKSALSVEGGKPKLARRVSFDPLALLLDASLEGELELVQKTATQVNEIRDKFQSLPHPLLRNIFYFAVVSFTSLFRKLETIYKLRGIMVCAPFGTHSIKCLFVL